MKGKDIKACPFCGNDEVEYSTKTVGDRYYADGSKKRVYHISVYCTKCYVYGPRVMVKFDYPESSAFNAGKEIREVKYVTKAINAWNNRGVSVCTIDDHVEDADI